MGVEAVALFLALSSQLLLGLAAALFLALTSQLAAVLRAPASLLAPFGYFEMVSAVILGFLWFGDFPDRFTWLGIAVIVSTGIYISLRERKRKQALRAPAGPQG